MGDGARWVATLSPSPHSQLSVHCSLCSLLPPVWGGGMIFTRIVDGRAGWQERGACLLQSHACWPSG